MTVSNKNSVVMCFDRAYGPAACVALTSLFLNSGSTEFQIDLLQTDSDPIVDAALEKLALTFNRVITQHLIDKSTLAGFHVSNHLSSTAYLRFFIEDYVEADKVLYLDCDLIVQCDVGQLFNVNLNGEELIAGIEDLTGSPYAKDRLGISDAYINSGMLLIDLPRWKKEGIRQRLTDFCVNNADKITWHDQCVINGALRGRKKLLDNRFNLLFNDLQIGRIKEERFSASTFEGIFHYNSTIKPWHRSCDSRYKALWDKYAAVSPVKPLESIASETLGMDLQELRRRFINREIAPIEWLGDAPTRFDDYTRYAEGCHKILELGVYTGLSTVACLMAQPESIISIDITDEYFSLRPDVEKIAHDMGVEYQFIKMNDLDYKSDGQDLLFVDTTHTFEQTIQELNTFGQLTSKRIVLHDVSSHPGVYQAVFNWLWENKNFRIVEHDSRGDGIVVLERHAAITH